MSQSVECWGIHEVSLAGPSTGTPFDVQLSAELKYKNRSLTVDGFYDGGGVYRIRFMPDTPGLWQYVTRNNVPGLDGQGGEFTCIAPAPGNHGPVRVRDTYHFAYADGTPHIPVGTTCYVWNHQGDALEEQTLETLKSAPFNKMRMCVFPKDYLFNKNEPPVYPFERDASGGWDWARFNPVYFQHLEQRVADLLTLGIEADIILFHPYDRWGFATMSAETDDRYLRYVVARLAAYRNVWWSLANEYDLMREKTMANWDRFFRIVQESDPYGHLRSVHNCRPFYDHGKPWVTHCSVQHHDLRRVREWRELYRKPVVVDECGYEGNIERSWGSLPAQELVHRFWLGACSGGYVGHGETYLHPQDILWWSKGGVLHGESPARIAFLRRILEEGPADGLEPVTTLTNLYAVGKGTEYRLIYLAVQQPAEFVLDLPEEAEYQVEVIDTWAMAISPLAGRWRGKSRMKLPGRPYLALRIQKSCEYVNSPGARLMSIVEYERDGFLISTDKTRLDIDVIQSFLSERSYWAQGRPLAVTRQAIENSFCFGVYDGTAQVGFARVVTDYATFAWLADVFVLESHRGRGLAKWLVQCVVSHPDLRGLRQIILATRDAHELYRKYGEFQPVPPERFMARRAT